MDATESSAGQFVITAALKRRAIAAGFDAVGVTSAKASPYAHYMREWVAAGRHGSMAFMENRLEERVDPQTYLPGARSVICVAMNYYVPLEPVPDEQRATYGRISRYALGDDYHKHLRRRLRPLADWIEEAFPPHRAIACIDTSPLPEKVLAMRAGLGWMGKHTNLIHPRIGSWLLLGEIVTTLELDYNTPATDHCGTCTRCIDACPTAAITAPYELDARRCISYLTIEHRADDIDADLRKGMGDWLYGCDVCQDVCPFNRLAPTSAAPEFRPRFPTGGLDAAQVLSWSEEDYRRELKGSAMKRTRLPVMQRNARTVLANKSHPADSGRSGSSQNTPNAF